MDTLAAFLEAGYRVIVLWVALAFHPALNVTPGLGDGYWHTHTNQILDSGNRPVRIAGINWYGFETTKGIPGGLDVQDYKSMLDAIKKNGYNTVRIPISNQMVETPTVPTDIRFANHDGPINIDLKGLTSLQILDHIITYAESQGIKIILDNHRSEAGDGPEMSGLWFTQAYPEGAWIADWQMLAQRYASNPTVIGFDLRNEPHNASGGGACWNCGGANDWHLAAIRAGDAVLRVNPRLLIFVEGVDSYENDFYWWGGNLEGVRTSPVNLAVPNQLVYSAHDYGPVESGQPWFTPDMTADTLSEVWTKHWAYISQDGIAPVWLGEFGVDNTVSDTPTPTEATEALWFQSMIDFLHKNQRISWSYWTVNGGDHNGLLDANYNSTPRNSARQDALATIQAPLAISLRQHSNHLADERASSIIPTVSAAEVQPSRETTVVEVVPPPQSTVIACHITFSNLKDWQKGFTGAIVIHNTGQDPIEGWRLTWTFPGNQKLHEVWDGNYGQDGQTITLTSLPWNSKIPAGGEQIGIGFNASYTGSNPPPAQFYLNGTLCK